ncbi:MAG TPA: hypothetical protein VJ782_02210 [Aeromicrobium sp.]|nr:hypothetical protein [Aeromicrobium sp.]
MSTAARPFTLPAQVLHERPDVADLPRALGAFFVQAGVEGA